MNNNTYQRALRRIEECGSLYPSCCCLNPNSSVPALDSILIDNDGTQTVTTNTLLNLGSLINSTGDSISYVSPNSVTLSEPGTYYILYSALVSNTATAGDIGASLTLNGSIIPNASEYIESNDNENQIVLQHSVTITSPTTLTIQNNSSVSNDYHDSSLSIIRLG